MSLGHPLGQQHTPSSDGHNASDVLIDVLGTPLSVAALDQLLQLVTHVNRLDMGRAI